LLLKRNGLKTPSVPRTPSTCGAKEIVCR
jgi:hypothetical protein